MVVMGVQPSQMARKCLFSVIHYRDLFAQRIILTGMITRVDLSENPLKHWNTLIFSLVRTVSVIITSSSVTRQSNRSTHSMITAGALARGRVNGERDSDFR